MNPNLEWWVLKGVGLLRVGAPKGGSPNLEKVGSRRVGGPKGGGPKPRKVGPRWVGHPRVGHPRVEGWGTDEWEAQNFALFSLPATIFFLSSLASGSFRGILVVF